MLDNVQGRHRQIHRGTTVCTPVAEQQPSRSPSMETQSRTASNVDRARHTSASFRSKAAQPTKHICSLRMPHPLALYASSRSFGPYWRLASLAIESPARRPEKAEAATGGVRSVGCASCRGSGGTRTDNQIVGGRLQLAARDRQEGVRDLASQNRLKVLAVDALAGRELVREHATHRRRARAAIDDVERPLGARKDVGSGRPRSRRGLGPPCGRSLGTLPGHHHRVGLVRGLPERSRRVDRVQRVRGVRVGPRTGGRGTAASVERHISARRNDQQI